MFTQSHPWIHRWLLAALTLGLAAGCGKPRGTEAEQTAQPAQASAATDEKLPPATEPEDGQPSGFHTMEALCAEANQLASQDQMEPALAVLRHALRRDDLREFRPEFVFRGLGLLLARQQMDRAQTFFLECAETDPTATRHAFGIIENELATNNRFADLAAWCERLANAPVAVEFLPAVADWHFKALRGEPVPDAARKVLERYEKLLAAPAWISLADAMARTLLAENQLDAYRELLGFLESKQVDRPDLRSLCASLRLQLLLAEKQWAEAGAFFTDLAARVDDALATHLFNTLQNSLLSERQSDLADGNSRLALGLADKPALRQAAARTYLRTSLQRQDVTLTLARIAELRDLGFGHSAVIGWLSDAYPDAMRKGTDSDFKAMLAIGQPIFAGTLEERDRAVLAGILLDVMFRLDLFADAVAVLDSGLPGQDETWHASMKNKVLAHLALQQGRKEEALERFTKFLNESAVSFEETQDPITGDRITRDMVLALNHKRIGEIQASLGRPADAAASFTKAREFYDAALKTVDSNSDQAKRLTADRDAMPTPAPSGPTP